MNILNVIEVTASAFVILPVREKILSLLFFGFLIIAINVFFILPLVFNFKIIPGIEEKMGRRLEFDSIYNYVFFFGNYFVRFREISAYIFLKYLNLKFSFFKMKKFALTKANYSREEFFQNRNILELFLYMQ